MSKVEKINKKDNNRNKKESETKDKKLINKETVFVRQRRNGKRKVEMIISSQKKITSLLATAKAALFFRERDTFRSGLTEAEHSCRRRQTEFGLVVHTDFES